MSARLRTPTLALILLAALAAALAGCGLLPPGIVPEQLNPVLVTLEMAGGECPQGACGFTAEIRRDGTVIRSDGVQQTVAPPELARLVAGIEQADWDAILATPFLGECPRNFDGQEETYTFPTGGVPIVIASCTVVVDHAQEPFRTIWEILFGVGG